MPKSELMICVEDGQDAEAIRNKLTELTRKTLEVSGLGKWKEHGLGTYDKGSATKAPSAEFFPMISEIARAMGHLPVLTSILDVDDFEIARTALFTATKGTELEGTYTVAHWPIEETADSEEDELPYKSIEIYYNISDIPAGYDHYLDFRNAAMEHIERALEQTGAGEWAGAESGMGEVNFGFEVSDFDVAEKIVRGAVAGTKYDCIREITRYDSSEHDYSDYQ